MKVEDIETVAIIGAGTMGSGIAQVFAEAKFRVYLVDETYVKSIKGREKIGRMLEKKIETIKNVRENFLLETLQKIIPLQLSDLKLLKRPQFVIEAVFENLETKQVVFRELDGLCDAETILATNTSSVPIHEISEAVSNERKSKIIGMHFMNPPYILKLLEIIRSKDTSDETYNLVHELAKKLGREPILTSKDTPGFLCNRILMPPILEALRALEDNAGSANDIDLSVKAGVAGAMDVLKLGDLIGWDIVLNITKILRQAHGLRYEPPQILLDLVKEGYLGRKTKKGIFEFAKQISRNEVK